MMMIMKKKKNARCNTYKQTIYDSPSTSVAIHSCLSQDRYDARQVLLSMRCDLALGMKAQARVRVASWVTGASKNRRPKQGGRRFSIPTSVTTLATYLLTGSAP